MTFAPNYLVGHQNKSTNWCRAAFMYFADFDIGIFSKVSYKHHIPGIFFYYYQQEACIHF